MNQPTASPWFPFPRRHERVCCANILLLGSLPLLAGGLRLVALSDTVALDIPQEVSRLVFFYVVLCLAALLAWRGWLRSDARRVRVEHACAALGRWGASAAGALRARPLAALWLASLAGVLVSCYPVVFGGKSFVSPNTVKALFYNRLPSLPHGTSTQFENLNDVDTGATMWQNQPYSVVEHRAIFQDHELPVWDRYNSGGLSLIGQGQSMLGDPLNWLVVLAGGGPGAWDLRFLVARLLFAAGIGLCVRAATERLAAALLLAFSACFLGFFSYRLNHPANFALCYAPWILFAWLRIVRGGSAGPGGARAAVPWVGLLLLACWLEFNSGAAKEAAILLVCLNGTGLLVLLLDDRRSWRWKGRALAGLAWAGVGFVVISAPLWRTFLESLAHSWNYYEDAPVWQLQPTLLIGLFNDIFYRPFNRREELFDPSASFVILLGLAFALAAWRTLARRHRLFLALGLSCLLPLALVFGVVPSALIRLVPFVGKVMHIDNTFTCVLLVPLTVLAGFGLERCRERLGARDWAWDYLAFAAVPVGLLALYLGGVQAVQRSTFSPLPAADGPLPLSAFFMGYVVTLMLALLALPLLLRWWRQAGASAALGAVPAVALCLGALLWRGGLQERAAVGWDPYVMHVGPRQNVRVDSPAVDRLLAATRSEPGRVFGFQTVLVGGYASTFGLETPCAPDALENRDYHRLLEASPMPFAWGWLWLTNRKMASSEMRKMYDMLNIRFYAEEPAPGTTAPADLAGLRAAGRYDLDLYESPTAWPRAFFTDVLVPSRGDADFLNAVFAGDGRPFAAVVPADLRAQADWKDFAPLLRGPRGGAGRTVVRATDYRLTSRTTSFRVRAPGPGVAVLLEGYQLPYNAQVYLNGKPVPHLRTDQAFMSVRLPGAGEYAIRVVYGPRDLPLLLGVSALGLALLAGTAWWVLRGGRAGEAGRSKCLPVPTFREEESVEILAAAP